VTGDLRELRFLLGCEVHFHASKIRGIAVSCQPRRGRSHLPLNVLIEQHAEHLDGRSPRRESLSPARSATGNWPRCRAHRRRLPNSQMSSAGMRVPFSTGRPRCTPGFTSTRGQSDQSIATFPYLLTSSLVHRFMGALTPQGSFCDMHGWLGHQAFCSIQPNGVS
jgi:hypothetical protein